MKYFFSLAIASRFASAKLRWQSRKCRTINDYVDLAFSFKPIPLVPRRYRPYFIEPWQVQGEILKFMTLVHGIQPQYACEIGTAEGGVLFLLTRVCREDAFIASIDLPGGPFGGGYPLSMIPFYRSFARDSQRIHLIRGDSHRQSTLEYLRRMLNGRRLDFLFIDGDHTYEGVKNDFLNYWPLVREGGLAALHDILPHPYNPEVHVDTFWKELLRSSWKTREIVEDYEQGGVGIGVVFKTERPEDEESESAGTPN